MPLEVLLRVPLARTALSPAVPCLTAIAARARSRIGHPRDIHRLVAAHATEDERIARAADHHRMTVGAEHQPRRQLRRGRPRWRIRRDDPFFRFFDGFRADPDREQGIAATAADDYP